MSVTAVYHVPSPPAAFMLTVVGLLQFAFARKRAAGQHQDVHGQPPQGRCQPQREDSGTSTQEPASQRFADGYTEETTGTCWALDKDSIEAENRQRVESMSVAEVCGVILLGVGWGDQRCSHMIWKPVRALKLCNSKNLRGVSLLTWIWWSSGRSASVLQAS